MAFDGQPDAVARIGAEIAYTVATKQLKLQEVIMQDPSQPGADLYTSNGHVVIEARMLQRTQYETGSQLTSDIQKQLGQMVGKVQSDFGANKSAAVGYAIFSYIDNQGIIETIVLKVVPT